MTSTTSLLLTVASVCVTSTINGQTISQSNQQIKRPKRPLPPSIKGKQSSLTPQQQYQKKKQQRALKKLNLLKQTTVHGTGNGGAFNPNLAPNSQSKMTQLNTPSEFNPCPSDTTFSGNRASYDCTSYIYCSGGTPIGDYLSCMGLSFDNEKGVCDWKESVYCESIDGSSAATSDSTADGESSSSGGGEGVTNVIIGSTTAISTAESQNAGSVGATSNEKSDWGGHWVGGKWVSDSQETDPSLAWLDTQWDSYNIVSYPPHEVLPLHFRSSAFSSSFASAKQILPSEYISYEGWSYNTRWKEQKSIIGYYASWQLYDNAERAKPSNIEFSKLDRVNYAFFQCDGGGNIWGMDSWADPIALFGPHDWSRMPVPEHSGHYPQFYDNNGFDDTTGDDWNYVGSQYLPHGDGVYCHRATPTGMRDCNAHKGSEGLIGRAHSMGAEVFVSIGGWSKSSVFPAMAGNARSRRTFAQNCVGLIREYNFDGIDLDWEFPGHAPQGGTVKDRDNFILLLQDIRSALDAYTKATYPNGDRTFGLTAALPCNPAIINNQNVPQVSDILSELNLMTFDFHGVWDAVVGHNAPLYDQESSPGYSANACIEHWVRDGADKSKINIGLPFYGRSYGDATELYDTFNGADLLHWWSDEGKPQYHSIMDQLPDMISLRDDVTQTQYAWFESGGLVSFDDRQSICTKVEYGRVNELHGYFIWELSGDMTEDLNTPLLDVINYKLDQGDSFDCELFRLETRDDNGDVIGLMEKEPDPWYVKTWESGTCVNDGKQPEWEKEDNLFKRKEECCAYKFAYKVDDCIGSHTPPTAMPSKQPSSSPVKDQPTTINKPSNTSEAAKFVLRAPNDGSPSPVAREAIETKVFSPSPDAPVTWCLGGCKGDNEKCVGNQNNPQSINDKDCRPCQSGQTFWPCDVDGLCFCWDETLARIPPAPASGLAQLSNERPCDFFTESIFNSLAANHQHPYTYDGLCKAIDSYNEGHAEKIFMMGTEEERKSELAAFLGHTLHESDEWKASREYLMCADKQEVGGETYCKPCDSGSFNWETFTCDGPGLAGDGLTFNGYCDYTIEPPLACPCDGAIESEPAPLEGYIPASKVFFGRGAIQLSWNYNFRAASEALTGDSTTFCDDPDLVATTPEYAWGAGVFFWMENLKEETTCHIEALRNHDFGGTLNNINGGLECPAFHGGWHGEAIKLRLNRYCKASSALGLESILVMEGCKGLNTSFAECLGDGTCPDCEQFSEGVEPIILEIDSTHSEPVSDEAIEVIPVETNTSPESQPVEVIGEVSQEEVVQLDAPTSSCPEDLKPVDGLPGCCVTEPAYHGDGACDPDSPYNTPECEFDGGDCCRGSCFLGSHYGCSNEPSEFGPFGFYCINPTMVDEYIDPSECTVSDRTRIGDGRCDAGIEMYNTEACNWDGGDCCMETCNQLYAHYDCGPFDCQNPDYIRLDTLAPSSQPIREATAQPQDKATSHPTTLSPVAAPKTLAGSIASSFAAGSFAASSSTQTDPSLSVQSESLESIQVEPITVIVSEDATIAKNSPASNYGSDEVLKVKGLSSGPNAHDALLKFNIPATSVNLSAPITALLRIYSLSSSDHGGIVHTVPHDAPWWGETDVTWDTAPDVDTRLGHIGAVEANRWYTIDVSDAVSSLQGSYGTITLRIRSRDPQVVEYSSREGEHPPEIMVILPGTNALKLEEVYGTLAAFSTETETTSQPDEVVFSLSDTNQSLPEQGVGAHVLTPSDDATILADHPNENYGSSYSLQVDNDSGVYDTLIKFDVSSLDTSTIVSATLRLYCTDGSDSGGIVGKTVTSNWDESSVTWNTAPAAYGSPIASIGSVEKATWYDIDVTDLFSSGDILDAASIRITSNSWNRAMYSSKEGQEPPQLAIHGTEEASYVEPVVIEADSTVNSQQAAVITGTGLYFPVWGADGDIACTDGNSPPSWAKGAYLKTSKTECCQAFFQLQVNECLES